MYTIYKVTNLVNSKLYIGVTKKDVFTRIKWHSVNKKSSIYSVLKEEGIENLKIEVLAKYESKKEAYKSEEKLILELKSYNPDTGYNVNIGNKIPKELMGKRIDQLKAIIKTPEQIEMIRNLGLKRKGKKATKETKERLSKSHMGQMAWNKGKKLTPEHIEKLRNAKLGKKLSNEHKENIKKSHLSRVIS